MSLHYVSTTVVTIIELQLFLGGKHTIFGYESVHYTILFTILLLKYYTLTAE